MSRDPSQLGPLLIGLSFIAISAAVVSTGPAQAAPVAPASLPDMVEKVMPGVVNISSTTIVSSGAGFGMDEFMQFWGIPQERKHSSLGSGFLLDKDGFVVTNDHVVSGATEVVVTLFDKREYPARIIGKDQKMDLALLQIRTDDRKIPENLTPVPLGDSDSARIAETVFAVGNPFGLQHTVTVGIISAKNRTIGQGPFDNFIQTDASINPGNSGGPLFNLKGEVVGINTVIFSRTGQWGGVGFAIPANEAKRIVPDLKKYGRVPRPWLGIMAETMTPGRMRYYRFSVSKGVLIYNLVESGPALNAGLEPGDIIVSINGVEATEPNDVERELAKHRPNESITVKYYRGKRTREAKIKLQELPRLDRIPRGII